MKPIYLFLSKAACCLLVWFSLSSVQAQMRVGQPSGPPDGSSALDVNGGPYPNGSTFRGLNPPKVALSQSSQADPITKPALGLLVYNTAKVGDVTPGYYYWEGKQWVRFSTNSSTGAARSAAAAGGGQYIPAYLLSEIQSLTTTSDHFFLVEPGREGLFRYDASDTTTPSDSALTLVPSNSRRYKRILNDRIITPQMFGAIADDGNDDSKPLQAFLNVTGSYKHRIPSGLYLSNQKLNRIDKNNTTLEGDGYNKTEIRFTADTDGLAIQNNDYGGSTTYYGTIIVRGIKISSGGTKSSTRKGLIITNQHLQRPGPTVEGVAVWSTTAGQEWGTAILFYESSQIVASNIDIQSASTTVTTGISISSAAGIPAVEQDISKFNIRTVKIGIALNSGGPGVEGVQISDGTMVNVYQGIYAYNTAYGPPYLGVRNTHINSYGGEAIYSVGYQQITLLGCVFYVNSTASLTPARAMYFYNPIFLTGNATVISTAAGMANLVEFSNSTGVGGLIDFDLSYAFSGNSTNVIYMPTGYIGVKFGLNGLFNGSGSWTGSTFAGPGASLCQYKPVFQNTGSIPDQSLVQFQAGTGTWKPVLPHVANTHSSTFVTTSTTINPALHDLVDVNSSSPVTITVDISTMKVGQSITVRRYNNTSTGNITVRTLDNTNNFTQDAAGVFQTSVLLPTTGERLSTWYFNGAHLAALGGNTNSLDANANLADLPDKPGARSNLGLGTASTHPATDFINASSGRLVPTGVYSFTLTSWSTTTYTPVITPGDLTDGVIYLVKVRLEKSGTDVITQSYLVPITISSSSSSGTPDNLNYNITAYGIGTATANYVKLRAYKPTSGNATVGLEAALSTAGLAGSTSFVTISVTPLF